MPISSHIKFEKEVISNSVQCDQPPQNQPAQAPPKRASALLAFRSAIKKAFNHDQKLAKLDDKRQKLEKEKKKKVKEETQLDYQRQMWSDDEDQAHDQSQGEPDDFNENDDLGKESSENLVSDEEVKD